MLRALLEWGAPNDLVGAARTAGAHVGVGVVGLFVVDMEQQTLRPLPGSTTGEPYDIDATLAGRAYRTMKPAGGEAGGSGRLFVPLLDSSERLGVLEAQVDEGADPLPATLLAGTLAKMMAALRSSSDVLQRARRTRPMRLAAEIQWELLPPLTLDVHDLTISGILEPCYEIGGDAFDYAVNDERAHLLLVDAMGHGLDSSLIASLAVGSYRHCRRGGEDLLDMYASMDAVVANRFGDRFATAQLVELDRGSGALRWINAGHPAGMLVRDGKMVGRLEHPPAAPVGLSELGDTSLGEFWLQPGDAVLWFTDGVVDARSPSNEFFGEDRLADLLTRALGSGAPVPEVVRRLKTAVMKHQSGELHDDATMLFLVWNGRP